MAEFTPEWLFLTIVYIVLSCINIYAVILYRKAYYEMKRTLIIRSVYYLMIALLIENVYFAITAIAEGFNHSIGTIMMYPLLWSIPKLLLLFAILFFVVGSLSPNESIKEEFCEDYCNCKPRKNKK